MKKTIVILFLIIISPAFSQTVDEVIDRYAAAIGSYENINGISSLVLTGVISSDTVKIPVSVYIKGKDKIRMTLTIKNSEVVQVYDGSSGWYINPFSGSKEPLPLDAGDISDLKETLEWEGKIINYKKKGYKAELVESEDNSSFKIRLTDNNDQINYYYIDKQTSLINKQLKIFKTDSGDIVEENAPSDYKKIGGILFAMSSDNKVTDYKQINAQTKTVFDKIEVNPDIDDSIFKKPN